MNILRYGSRGTDVATLQLALRRAGDYSGNIDGIFGRQTEAAVLAFQSRAGLVRDGIVGRATWEAVDPFLSGYVMHTVGSGDSFFSLAGRYGTTIEAIRTANPAVEADNIAVGSELTIPLGFALVPTEIAYSSYLTEAIVAGLAARYPFISTECYGQSVAGEPLFALELGTGERTLIIGASIHANEWITSPLVLRFAEEYANAVASGGRIGNADAARLYAGTRLIILPLMNPDGVDLVTGVINSGAYYESARRIASRYPNVRFPLGWKANIAGTDLNLQFPAGWERAREIKFAAGYTTPAPRDYVGTAPFSAPESRAVADFTSSVRPDALIAFHSQGEVIYWKYADFNPPGALALANAMADASGYSLELTPEESAYAGYKDWFIAENNLPGYTIEVGRGISPLPLSQFPAIYEANRASIVTALDFISI